MHNIDGQNLKCLNSFDKLPWLTNSLVEAETNAEPNEQPENQVPEGGDLGLGPSSIQAYAEMGARPTARQAPPARVTVADNSAPSLAPDLDDLALDATFEITLLTSDDLLSKEIGLNVSIR